MGAGIAQVLAHKGGYNVTLSDVTDKALTNGQNIISKSLSRMAKKSLADKSAEEQSAFVKEIVDSIHYDDGEEEEELVTKIVCTDGEVIEADEVVLTTPLGVLKSDVIDFDPPLPNWKQGAIDRMGFGLLNKVCVM